MTLLSFQSDVKKYVFNQPYTFIQFDQNRYLYKTRKLPSKVNLFQDLLKQKQINILVFCGLFFNLQIYYRTVPLVFITSLLF